MAASPAATSPRTSLRKSPRTNLTAAKLNVLKVVNLTSQHHLISQVARLMNPAVMDLLMSLSPHLILLLLLILQRLLLILQHLLLILRRLKILLALNPLSLQILILHQNPTNLKITSNKS